jgi:hypothetical protein
MPTKTQIMKILFSEGISSFGGLNFVHEELEKFGIQKILEANLPKLPPQSQYLWKDVFYSLLSIYFCGGDCIEDVKTVLSQRFGKSPLFKLCSPDTILRRLKGLEAQDNFCKTKRGTVEHQYNYNERLAELSIKLLKKCGEFDKEEVILDYDNTIAFNEKADSKMTYKRNYGYQPGVCFLNEDKVLCLENRNGNSDAKSFQADTLARMFACLDKHGIHKVDKFRADSASYQFDVIKLLEGKASYFYIGAKNSYVEKYFAQIPVWEKTKDTSGEDMWIGEITFRPFAQHYKSKDIPIAYRLLVKKKPRIDGKANLFTNEAFDYWAVVTNDFTSSLEEGLSFYYYRGAVERQFDVLKNDFGWSKLPFSKLSQNTVFLYFAAIIKNLYSLILMNLSSKYKSLRPNLRMKRFIFLFISIPARWVKRSRQWYLRLYGSLP